MNTSEGRTRTGLRMSDWPIGVKIFSAVMVVVVVALAVGGLGIVRIDQLRDRAEAQLDEGAVPLMRLDAIRNATLLLRNDVTAFCLAPNAEALTKRNDKVKADAKAVNDAINTYRKGGLDAVRSGHVATYQKALDGYLSLHDSDLAPVVPGHDLNAIDVARGKMTPLAGTMATELDALLTLEQNGVKQVSDAAHKTATQSTILLSVTLAVGLLIALLLAGRVQYLIVRPLREVAAGLTRIAHGDLVVTIPVRSNDEVGQMSAAAATATGALRQAMRTISDSVTALIDLSKVLDARSQEISTNAQNTADQAANTSTAAQAVSSNVDTIAAATHQLTASISEIAKSAQSAMEVGNQAATEAAAAGSDIATLGDASQAIGQMVTTIAGIADQTHLLAINATIEAARAGASGKGFGVVASEVKDLASATANATNDIGVRATTIQGGTSEATAAIDRITTVIHQANDYQTTIASAIEQQVATASETSRSVHGAATAAEEIAANMTVVSDAAAASLASTHATRQAVSELTRLADGLADSVSTFRW